MYKYFANALIVNEGREEYGNILVKANRIEAISNAQCADGEDAAPAPA